jgi:hypothetical protein
MNSLFPTATARAAQGNGLVQFPAGKCILTQQSTGKYMVTADSRRGQIQLTKGADGILRFRWINLSNGAVEDDRMVFGNDCIFKKVKTGRANDTKDRVYMLKFHGESKPLMFWFQNPDSSKDEELVKQTNKYLENPNSASNAGGDIMQMLGQRGSIPTAAPIAAPSSSSTNSTPAPFGNLDLSSLLSTMSNLPTNTSQQARPSTQLPPQTPALQDEITGDDVARPGILNDPELQEELQPLLTSEQRAANSADQESSGSSQTNAEEKKEEDKSMDE